MNQRPPGELIDRVTADGSITERQAAGQVKLGRSSRSIRALNPYTVNTIYLSTPYLSTMGLVAVT